MPNRTTVVQTASDLFEPEIRLNSPKKLHFSALYPTKKPSKIFRYCSVNNKKIRMPRHRGTLPRPAPSYATVATDGEL